jgi:hypothetical protein
MRRACVAIALSLLTAGCSRPSAPAPAATAPPDPDSVQVEPIAAVAPNTNTHLATGSTGVYFVQETDDGDDSVYRLNDLDLAVKTELSSASIAAALGRPAVHGNFQDITAADDDLYFYFVGREQRNFVSCLGKYSPDGKLKILADDQKLGQLTGAGDTLSICQGNLTQSAGIIWLWLHSAAGSYFVQADSKSSDPAASVHVPFTQLTSDMTVPVLTHDSSTMGAGPNGSVLIIDGYMGILWEISPDGVAAVKHNLTGLPSNLSSPVMDSQERTILFATGGDMIPPRLETQHPEAMDYTEFPALLILGSGRIQSFGKSVLRCNSQFPAEDLHIVNLCATTDGSGWIGYDPGAGELFKLQLVSTQ